MEKDHSLLFASVIGVSILALLAVVFVSMNQNFQLLKYKAEFKNENPDIGLSVGTSQQTLGFAVSNTIFTVSTVNQELSPSRTNRLYARICNLDPVVTAYWLLAPSTSIQVVSSSMPLPANTCDDISQGKGNLYNGQVSLSSSTVSSRILFVEKFK